MKFILGKKVEMTQIWQNDQVVPVTKVMAGPCTVLQIKNVDKDGYEAVQVGYGDRRLSLFSKPLLGHFKNLGGFRFVREFRVSKKENLGELKVGDQISVATFQPGDRLTVVGTSKGKGFQGSVKRHGFHGQDATHGNKDQLRASGSVGAGGVQHVFKGTRMSGRMGGDRVTLHDVEVVEVDEKNNTLLIKGALPGARNSLVMFFGEGELKLGLPEVKAETPAEEAKTEEVIEEVKEETPAEEPKAEEPKAEEPKVEEPKVEEAPIEEVKVEEAAEASEAEVKNEEAKTE